MSKRAFRLTPYEPAESAVLDAILRYLAIDRRVAKAIRYNSGAMKIKEEGGKQRFVRFNTAPGHPDIGGYLKGGRAFYFEVKKPGKSPTDDQSDFIEHAKRHGAIAAVIESVEEAKRVLDERV